MSIIEFILSGSSAKSQLFSVMFLFINNFNRWFIWFSNFVIVLIDFELIGNRTSCRPLLTVIILVIKQIGFPRILLITRMITDRIGLHSALLPLLIHTTVELQPSQRSRLYNNKPQSKFNICTKF